ncbi:MAG: hypothetical protein KKG47_07990 [Proteobacteria bacterium]|nr:hypothetical protein [Pseudomonadota bacterium]MBU1738239.1 hypothetical protein [Pseudomonadota bacterium]
MFKGGLLSCVLFRALLVCALLLFQVPAEAWINYNGSQNVNEMEDGRLLQSSSQRVSVDAVQMLSDRTTTQESVLIHSSWSQGYGITAGARRDTLSPSMSLLVNNDIFLLGVSGSANHSLGDSSQSSDSDTTELQWSSKWSKPLVPTLQMSVSQRNTYDTLDPHLTDKEDQTFNSALEWQAGFVQFYYNFTQESGTDRVAHSESDTVAHLARLSANREFLDKRLRFHFSQDFSENTSASSQHFVGSGSVRVPGLVFQAYAGADPNPIDSNDFALPSTIPNVNIPALADGDTTISAYTATPLTNDHTIIVRVGNSPVDLIYLYTDVDLGANSIALSNWRLYTNILVNTPPFTWTDETSVISVSPPVSYDSVNRRYVIALTSAISQNYLKFVMDNTLAGVNVQVTEVEVSSLQTGTPGSTTTSESRTSHISTGLGVGYKISERMQLNYQFDKRLADEAIGEDTDQTGHSFSLHFNSPRHRFGSTLNFSDRITIQDTALSSVERESRAFSFSLQKGFLPTLDGGVSGNINDHYLGGEKTSTNGYYSFVLSARLYPDLESSFDGRYSVSKQLVSENKTESYGSGFSLTSRLRPSLSMTLDERYEVSRLETGVSEKYASGLLWTWQSSEVMSINGSLRHETGDNFTDRISFGSNLALRVGYRMQLEILYSATEQLLLTQSGTLTWRWTLGKGLFWRTGVDYVQLEGAQRNHVKFFSSLSFRCSL